MQDIGKYIHKTMMMMIAPVTFMPVRRTGLRGRGRKGRDIEERGDKTKF